MCGAPTSETCTCSDGCLRTSTPAAPAWSRWMCDSRRCRMSVSASPRSLRVRPSGARRRLSGRSRTAPARLRSPADSNRRFPANRDAAGRSERRSCVDLRRARARDVVRARHSVVSTTSLSAESIFSQLAFECSAASARRVVVLAQRHASHGACGLELVRERVVVLGDVLLSAQRAEVRDLQASRRVDLDDLALVLVPLALVLAFPDDASCPASSR